MNLIYIWIAGNLILGFIAVLQGDITQSNNNLLIVIFLLICIHLKTGREVLKLLKKDKNINDETAKETRSKKKRG
jgi:hypothetical protein